MRKTHVISLFVLISTAFMLLPACNNTDADSNQANLAGEGSDEEAFAPFYIKFHQDSLFQISRIAWPLNGNYIQDSTGAAIDLRYKLEDWVMHKAMIDNPDFVLQIEPLTKDLYVEEIKARAGKYKIERRFARLDGGWHLIFYRVAGI